MARPNSEVDLVAISGAIEGLRVQLQPRETLLLGRTANGLQIPDELVSIYHAEIVFEEGSYWVADVGSATGTFVDDRKSEHDKVRLQLGNVIKVGETRLRVSRRQRFTPIEWVAIALPLVIAAAFIVVAWRMAPQRAPMRGLIWEAPIRRGPMVAGTTQLDVPGSFLRAQGVDVVDLRIRRVTDFDQNQVDEVWLRAQDREWAVTFEADGSWQVMGTLPTGCLDAPLIDRKGGMPLLRCPGVLYDYGAAGYRPAQQEGIVVWLAPIQLGVAERLARETKANRVEAVPLEPIRPKRASGGSGSGSRASGSRGSVGDEPVAEAAIVKRRREEFVASAFVRPHRLELASAERVAGFLAERGVDSPVHYLICEDAYPGVAAQVLTEAGEIVPLAFGCMDDLVVADRNPEEVGHPVAIAFTAHGHEALRNDVATFYGGTPDDVWLEPGRESLLNKLRGDAGYPLGYVEVDALSPAHFTRAIAHERPLGGARALVPAEGVAGPRPGVSATLMTPGVAQLDPPGCERLQIEVGAWQCGVSNACIPGAATFLRVDEVGCGEPTTLLAAGYRGGVTDGTFGGIEVRAVVDSRVEGNGARVRTARVAWRPAATPTP